MAANTCLTFLFCLLQLYLCTVHSQEYDESGEFCRKSGKTCPDDPAKPYEKYCCIDVYNRVPYPVCCSPYFGIEIGAGIGIPVVIMLVITVVAAYCCCLKIQQRRLANTHDLDDDSEDGDAGETQLQQYTRMANESEKPPTYSTEDPFPAPPEYTPLEGHDDDTNRQNGSQSTGNEVNIAVHGNPVGNSSPDVTGSRVSVNSSSSDNDHGTPASSEDTVPLIGPSNTSNSWPPPS